MVRIINGEIVSDDDPRVNASRRRPAAGSNSMAAAGGGSRGLEGAGYGRVATIHDPPASTPSDGRGARGTAATGGEPGGDDTLVPPPLDKLATAIGVQGRFMTLPGALGVAEKKVPVLYLMIAALLALIGGWKAAGIIVFAYVIINQGRR